MRSTDGAPPGLAFGKADARGISDGNHGERIQSVLRNQRLRLQSRLLPDWYAQPEPAARIATTEITLEHIGRDVNLQFERSEIIAGEPADGEFALLLIGGNRTGEVGSAVSHGSELPTTERLGRSEVEVGEIRIAALETKRRGTWRDLRPIGDAIELDTIDDIGGQVPAAAGITQCEPLIE